jgi:hypothetical protein
MFQRCPHVRYWHKADMLKFSGLDGAQIAQLVRGFMK